MHVIKARNVHQAIPEGIRYLLENGEWRNSRNSATLGPALVAPGPVATVYDQPMEKVEFWAPRNSNPVFHLMEALWMLAGRRDVAFPVQFNSTFGQFSDDGEVFNGAYGFRWRNHFGTDQLDRIATALTKNPDCRRQVLAMWDATGDLGSPSKDIPCNTHAYFTRRPSGELDMTVCCRSNDMIWGAYGSNAVHFSFLLEYMAARIGCPPGRYTHISNNFHAYGKTLEPVKILADEAGLSPGNSGTQVHYDPYRDSGMKTVPLVGSEGAERFDMDLKMFIEEGIVPGLQSRFLRRVAEPLFLAYAAFRNHDNPDRFRDAIEIAARCEADDWRVASIAWFERRRIKSLEKQ